MDTIRIACRGADVALIDDLVYFQGNLKTLSKINYKKLKKEILESGFSEPISVWIDDNKKKILNGHQRLRTLKWMRDQEGYEIPPVPINYIEARTEKEARRKVLALTSQYGEITGEGLYEFMSESDMKFEELADNFRFPEVNFEEFRDEFFKEPTSGGTGEETEEVPGLELFPQDEIIDDAFEYFRKKGFPYRELTMFEMKQELNKLAKLAMDSCLRSKAGYQIADTYHRHRFHAAANGMGSPFEAFEDDKKLRKALLMDYLNGGIDKNYVSFINLVSGTQSCSNFRPAFARMLYETYCEKGGRVFDSSTGYGGRLVGFLASHCHHYIGTDPNVPTFKANQLMAEDLKRMKIVTLFNSPIEDLDVENYLDSCDFAFTSPPYFTKEIYSTDDTQSCSRYPGYDDWIQNFLKPMLAKNYAVLKHDKMCIINIEDVQLKGHTYPLVQPTIDIGVSLGFHYLETKKFMLNHRTFMEDGEKTIEEAYESVIIFRK